MSEQEHKDSHDSVHEPVPGCEWCLREIRRRERRCFGDGESNVPPPVIPGDD